VQWGEIVRYTPAGLLDTSFGVGGILDLDVSDGRLVAMDSEMLLLDYPLSRRYPDGSRDTTFGVEGFPEVP
jgi:hypothetical protein